MKSNERATPSVSRRQRAARNALGIVGRVVSPDRNRQPNHILRRRGAAALMIGVLAAPAAVSAAEGAAAGVERVSGSNIPSHVLKNYDHRKFAREVIPQEGAFDFASQVDPNHDPRNGVDQMEEQLGHVPQPGDEVIVPIDEGK